MTQESILLHAIEAHQAGNLKAAEEHYRAILKIKPDHPDANHNLGILLVQKDQAEAALPCFLTAIQSDPSRVRYWMSYIKILIQTGQPEKARQILSLAGQQGFPQEDMRTLEGYVPTPDTTWDMTQASPHAPEQSKPVKIPGHREMDALYALFNKGRYKKLLNPARKMTERYPLHGLAWKVLAFTLMQMGQDALQPMQKAAELLPDDIEINFNLGQILHSAGRSEDAVICYRRVLHIQPDHLDSYNILGYLLRELSRLKEAEDCYRQLLKTSPDYFQAHSNLGNVLRELGQLEMAVASYQDALRIKPDFAEAYSNLGTTLKELGHLDEAITHYQQALQLQPLLVATHNDLGLAFKERGRLTEALASLQRAIDITPDYAEAHNNLGLVLRELGNYNGAVASFQRALTLKRDFSMAHNNLGGALKELGQLDDAVASFQQALAINPLFAVAHNNLGNALHTQIRYEAAIASFHQALALQPDNKTARHNLGLVQLASGQLFDGWKNHEFRNCLERKKYFHQPSWAGEDLAAKSILIWAEQGIGDEIMFASLYNEIIVQADRCVIECAPKLVPLFTRSFPNAQVFAKSEPPHPATQTGIDYQCAAGSLAQWLRPTLENFPQQNNFLIPDPARVAYWQNRFAGLGHGPKIGFCWRSSQQTGERNLHYTSLTRWGPIFVTPGVHFINLQYNECSSELEEASQLFGVPLYDFAEVDMYNDLDETAALIQSLDLVISAATAVSTIAAGIGVNTWVMSYGVSWETHGTDDCPWFPPLHYFNRNYNQAWDDVIGQVARELQLQKN